MSVPRINVDNWHSTFSKRTFFGTINHMLVMGQPMTEILKWTILRGRIMDKSTPLQEVAHLLDPALDSKIQELHLYGYDSVNAESIWNYLVNKKWKEIEGDLPLYLVVNDILTLKSGDFMNFTTRMEYKSAASSRKFNEDELQSLLHGQEGEKKDKSE
ncbi:hypothetical protein C4B60_05515 [Jeotgalibacillus proteolyticus]|uniref:Competence protein ComN n=2 Tax=Jeotgalibacillus proteolyticus TaxID=2082395 RepID=A0A2S5GF28_9BACL|nr:hypothetical protein C4B60_05515 [Jeotgalibacillus proteolyticus]